MSVLVKEFKIPLILQANPIKLFLRLIDDKPYLDMQTGGYSCSQQWTAYPCQDIPPHGRLIDADALIDKAKDLEEKEGITLCIDKSEDLEVFLDDYAPTIIEEEWEI